jgi:hypothetical protein
MLKEVRSKLDSKANTSETYEQFIRNSEEDFGMGHPSFELYTLDELEKYIEWLDYLWTK